MEKGYINLSLPLKLYKEFRRAAYEWFGDKKGYLSKAGSLAILNWVVTYEMFREAFPNKTPNELQELYFKMVSDFLEKNDKEDKTSHVLLENSDFMKK